jgi:hypothetical protein
MTHERPVTVLMTGINPAIKIPAEMLFSIELITLSSSF